MVHSRARWVVSGLTTTPACFASEEAPPRPAVSPSRALGAISAISDNPGAPTLRQVSHFLAIVGPSRLPQLRFCCVLRSARYPCPLGPGFRPGWLRAQQRPRVFRFSKRSGARASRRSGRHCPGSDSSHWSNQAASSLSRRLFPLACPGPVFGSSHCPQLRPCGLLWFASYPCQHHETFDFVFSGPEIGRAHV